MTLSPKLGVVGISTLWHFRLPLPIQMFTKVASSPRLSGIGMPSPILWSHPLKMQRIVLLSSLLWWELGTNSLITGPGEWLSFRRFTSKLSWSWSWSWPSNGTLAFLKYKRPVESLFGISNYLNCNASVSWPKSSLYTYTIHCHCANLWPWPSKDWKNRNKHFWNLLVKMNSLIYNNLDLQWRQVWRLSQ